MNKLALFKVQIFWEGHKIWKNLPLKIWRYWVASNSNWKIFSNFVAFSEYLSFTWTTDHIFSSFGVSTSGWRSIFQKFLFSTFAYFNTLAISWTFVQIPIEFTWGACIIFTTLTFFLLPIRLIEVFRNRTTDLGINFYLYFLYMISLPIASFDF